MSLFNPSGTLVPTAKPLPVLLLLDQSSSMAVTVQDGYERRIDELNRSVRQMLRDFADLCRNERRNIQLAIITFDSRVILHRLGSKTPYTPAQEVEWRDLQAGGMTCMGGALQMAKRLLEDTSQTPLKAYKPVVVLVSDGEPNDDWRQPLYDFTHTGRTQACDRLALMIGNDSAPEAMKLFVEGMENGVMRAQKAGGICQFFQFLSSSVATRSRAANPNATPIPRLDPLGSTLLSSVFGRDDSYGD